MRPKEIQVYHETKNINFVYLLFNVFFNLSVCYVSIVKLITKIQFLIFINLFVSCSFVFENDLLINQCDLNYYL